MDRLHTYREQLHNRLEKIFEIEPPVSYREVSAKMGIGPHVFSGFYRKYRVTNECNLRKIEKFIKAAEDRLNL